MGLLDWIDQKLGTRLNLLASDPSGAMQQMNQQAGAYNQASLLATQAERNALRGLPVTPEQAQAKQYVDKKIEDVAMGFAGTTSLKSPNMLELYHGTSPAAAKAIEKSGFDINKAADGTVWFTSNPNIGEVAASNKGAVVKRLLDKNKMKLGGWKETDKYSTDELINMGYDGLMLKDGNQITYQIFNPQKLQVGGNVSKNKIAPQQSALDIASQNAEKMLGLPKGNTPMDRAKALGYDTPAFHGTNRNFKEFSNEMLGATTGAKSAQKAHFLAANPEMSNTYVSTRGVYNSSPPAYEKLVKNKKAFKEFNDAPDAQSKWMVLEKYGMNYGGGRVIPVLAKLGNPKIKDYQGLGYRDETFNDLIKSAKKSKKDSVVFKNTFDQGPYEGANVQSDVYAIFNPANIRSRFAAFDPARVNEPDLLAAGVPLGLLAGTNVEMPKKDKRK